MNGLDLWTRLAYYLVFGMVIPATAFPIIYTLSFRWWRGPVGSALMTSALGIAGLVDIPVLYLIIGRHNIPSWVRFVIYLLVFLGLWAQLIVFLGIRFRKRTTPDTNGVIGEHLPEG